MRRKIITVSLFASLTAFSGFASLAADKETAVSLDGQALGSPALVDGGTVWLPVRAICEALGYAVSWSNVGGVITVSAVREGDNVEINVTRQKITQNGHLSDADVLSGGGVRLLSGRTYLDSGLFSSIFPAGASYDPQDAAVALQRRYPNNVTVANETISSQQEHLKTTIQYPQLRGCANTNAQSSINDVLKQAAQKAAAEGQKNAAELAQAIKDGYTGAVGMCETYFDYMITYNQNGILSVVLTDYQYAGGAHGSTVQTAYTFDLSSGKTLKLGDILDGKTVYTGFIDSAVRKEIDSRVAAGALYEFDFTPFVTVGQNPEFYLSNVGAVFYFQQYAYFPYAAGIQEFCIKYTELAPMLSNTYTFLADAPVCLRTNTQNELKAGDIGRVTLDGNPTTGYAWHYTISDGGVLALVSSDYTSASRPGLAGAGGTYVWNFKALTAGSATITFKYYRDWEGESSATPQNTAVYSVSVT